MALPLWKKRELICKICKKILFGRYPKKQLFCSKSCALKNRRKNPDIVCPNCRKQFYRRPNYPNKLKTCSSKCYGIITKIRGLRLGKRAGGYKHGMYLKEKRKMKSFYQRRREIRKKNNGGNHTIFQWKELCKKNQNTCLHCGKKEPEIKLTEDHIIPLSKGGSDSINNIQPLCMPCNRKKGNHNITVQEYNYISAES